tara:strand:- start:11362 stop:12147 length:786 start_codon:yes stop_codon:yes gene_type:complete
MINKLKSKSNLIYLAIAVIVILMLIFVRQGDDESEIIEESAGSGFIEIETFPGDGDIFVDGVYSGKSPITLYNIPIGLHNIVVKKEGYEDFSEEVDVEAGRKTFVEGRLVFKEVKIIEDEPQAAQIIEDDVESIGIVEEEVIEEEPEASEGNRVNIGSKLLAYYDFSEGEISDIRKFEHDIFSKRFKSYLVFTRLVPSNIKAINKGIDDIAEEDCIGIKGTFEYLYSWQSLCVITKEGTIAAIGGNWEETENAELKYKVFS